MNNKYRYEYTNLNLDIDLYKCRSIGEVSVHTMKRMLSRSTLIFAFTIAFIGGMGYFAFELVADADDWVDQAYNYHIAGANGLSKAGTIYDRFGTVLAESYEDGRIYNQSESIRKSLLHVVGDNSSNISTSVQSMYRSDLIGYNLIWGVNMPDSLRKGNNINLTVDADACAAAYDVLESYDKKGACVIFNYETGAIICSTSTLAYDPEAPPEITDENEDEYSGVYLDNVLSSTYTPGSTFKIITSAAAIENIPDLYERTWYCPGSKDIGGSEVTCVSEHGYIDFKTAMAHSCNIVFAELAVELGKDVMTETAEKTGINSQYDIGGVNTAKGHYDVTNANENQLGWSGVGQYKNEVNPLQMAIICGAIANGGKTKVPYVVDNFKLLSKIGITTAKDTDELFSSYVAEKLDEVMRYTITDYYGDDLFGGLTVCAKTGTGEVGENKQPNAWMVGYAKDKDCPLAFACVVEDAGFGFTYAGPVVEAAMIQAAKDLGADAVT